MKRKYELLLMFKSTATDEDLAKQSKHVEDIVKKVGGSVGNTKVFGRRRLSYRVSKQIEGYYYLIEFHLSSDKLDDLKRLLHLDEDILRFLVLGIDEFSNVQKESAGVVADATAR